MLLGISSFKLVLVLVAIIEVGKRAWYLSSEEE
jgi:hypothetical protein